MKSKKPWLLFVLLLILSSYTPCFSIAADTLSPGHSLSYSETILSQSSTFELGFFQLGTPGKIYLGIWYIMLQRTEVVWVANRENPLSHPFSARLDLSKDGNLLLFQASSEIPFWSTNLTFPQSNLTEAVLLDDGNFVLRDRLNTSSIFWESFDHLTDTWLPGAKLGINKVTGKPQQLISWKNSDDPAPGVFSFGLAPDGSDRFVVEWNRSQIYWSSGLWNGTFFSNIPYNYDYYLRGDIFCSFSFVSNENGRYFTYSLSTPTISKFVMTSSGVFKLLTWLELPKQLSLLWYGPRSLSNVYDLCGAFGVSRGDESDDVYFRRTCECLTGFEPSSMEDTSLDDWSGGCVRKSPLQCENITYANGKKDWFLKMSNMRLPVYSKAYLAVSARKCEQACMENCSCTAYAYNSSTGCMIWEGALLNLHQLSNYSGETGQVLETGQDIYLRLAADEHQSTKESGKKWKVWVAVLVPATGLLLCLFIYFSCKGKLKRIGPSNNLLLFDFDTELHAINDEMNTNNNLNKREKDAELPLFSYESVSVATNNFLTVNKLGEGGYGPVYKGKLFKGKEIAVKMLSKRSGQGIEEFKNEAILIAKLQHRNLVKLLGCCIEREEKILIYEYMPNKSLDFYLFDPSKKHILGWETRIHIIEGIAQGLLYLHQYSRLRIIHRDLKPSNILLDSEMNPKISDFGLARIVRGNETQANTNRIVGTYGYMSPEYATQGLYSIKSDVFSFGVLLLEIISGKKNTGFYNHHSLSLLRYAWKLWMHDRSLELMDLRIQYPSSSSIILRFINIGLLCVQESPIDRPTMLDVVLMISNEHAPLPIPKQPAFTICQNMMDTTSTVDNAENCSKNSVTISTMEAR